MVSCEVMSRGRAGVSSRVKSEGKGEIRRGLRVRVWASLRLGKKLG